ncbi:glycine-rich domain-containing protein 1-like isoform X2 [Juglans microcarpa x Juglans regia]|uniref:glycine-rich domain-containing protein 1-like isoform X2 n=1 Tax=Juglans microcarpa x Juglans regia TaxID=2249226 RepID=UPI001B7EB4C5|nr:glycine-rich domain-containing protein 1-like isoform X2 [Juglans microcarpa x Juglans regia]
MIKRARNKVLEAKQRIERMELEQEFEWNEAQNIEISVDLVAAAKRHLQFLAIVDRNRYLYDGPALERAIYRYNACWLPLLAKHSESQISEGPLVVPLDCEWVWHCHRLNPVQYKSDCEKLYGRILDSSNVLSSVQGTCQRQTEEIWNTLYPEEPYNFNLTRGFSEHISETLPGIEKYTQYDLVSAAKRQSPFFYQVSRPHMNNDHFLEGSVARYKGFLHLIKRNKEKFIRRFCVPTYDIDLIWHTHQLHPVDYCKDLSEVLGKVLEHDDMDSDRTKGKKLDVGFSGTTKQWEETFGRRYWRAGAMYRGSAPSPLTTTTCLSDMTGKEVVASDEFQKIIQLPQLEVVEVLLEFVGVKNLPEGHKGSLFVSFSKKQPDTIFKANRNLSILSESGEKQVASFQCEPTGELLFELKSHSTSNLPLKRAPKVLGSTSLFLQDFLAPVSELSVEKWLELVPSSSSVISKPIGLRVAVSFTVPSPAPHMLRMICSQLFPKSSCFFPLPGKVRHAKSMVHIIDETGEELLSLQMRDSRKDKEKENCILSKEVIGIMASGETRTLADFAGTGWFLMDSHWSLHFRKNSGHDGHLFELSGNRMVKFFPGRKLGYEPNHCEKHRSEKDFMTAVEFSMEDPYGKEVALLDLKSGIFNVKEEWMVVPGITAAFILADVFKKGGYDGFAVNLKNLEMESLGEEVNVDINAAISENVNLSGGGCGGKCVW